jgi:hypothetical protein
MSGKPIVLFLIAAGLVAGAAMYWLQVYAFYEEVDLADNGGAVTLHVTREDGALVRLSPLSFRGIDADSSPIRFRACFELGETPGDLRPYPDAVPLVAPGWFDCFDAEQIGADLEAGAATAYLGEENVTYGIDRIVALYPDGRGFAWHQINACGEVVFDGDPPPPGCPPVPERLN